jgi:hypothetical protein
MNEYRKALRCLFELIQLETGLEGNFLLRNYNTYECLETHSWFKTLWEYLDYYKVRLELSDLIVPRVRECEKVVIEEVSGLIPRDQWSSVNCARKHFKVYFTSPLVLCDGFTVRSSLQYEFPC